MVELSDTSSGTSSGNPGLIQFAAECAAGDHRAAVRSALLLLEADDPALTPTERADLIARLGSWLSELSRDQAGEVATALSQEQLPAAVVAQVLAYLSTIDDPDDRAARTRALLRDMQEAVPSAALQTLLADADPRVRAAAAAALAQRARAGDADAQAAVDRQRAIEPDPRVRRALDSSTAEVAFSEDRANALSLPPAAERSRPYTVETVWDPNPTSSIHECRNRSTITIAADGSATVDTLREDRRGTWHIRYDAWAWRDAAGKLVVDGRNQSVQIIEIPRGSRWIPDSLQISADGSTSVIDDHHRGGPGQTAMPGNG